MKHLLPILFTCLCATQLHAQLEKIVGTGWADGAEAYGCKRLNDSLIQFYGESPRSERQAINVQVSPDGGLAVTGKGFPPSQGFKYWMNFQGDTVVYKEIDGHRYVVFFHKTGRVYDVWEAMRKGESLDHFDARYQQLYGLAGTYLDSTTHRKIVFQPDTPIVTGLTSATHYHFGYSYDLMQPLLIFDNGQVLYYESNAQNWIDKIDILSVENFVEHPGSCSWDRGDRIMTLQKIGWVNVSGHPELPGRYSFGSTQLITGAIMTNFSRDQWRLIRNEIFARYGYRFKSPDLIAYFSAQPWYKPRYDDVTDKLTEIERINVELLNSR